MQPRTLIILGTACALALAITPLLASEPGNLMKITSTTHMQMAGMPNMGPMTRTATVCTSAAKPDPRQMMSRDKSCKLTHYQRSGNTISYHLECSGDMQMSGDGKFTLRAGGGIHGSMHMSGNAGGHSMVMDITEDGTRLGSCAYTPPPGR